MNNIMPPQKNILQRFFSKASASSQARFTALKNSTVLSTPLLKAEKMRSALWQGLERTKEKLENAVMENSFPRNANSSNLVAGPIVFGAPLMLLGLVTLPILWWLMKSVPPKPILERFPAVRFLFNNKSEDVQPAQMPLWQRLMRITMASLIILGFSKPMLNPDAPLDGNGPVTIVVDNGWSAAPQWDTRIGHVQALIDRAESEGRQIRLISTALPSDGGPLAQPRLMSADEAREAALAMQPQSWLVNRNAAIEQLQNTESINPGAVFWFSNGINDPEVTRFVEQLNRFGALHVLEDNAQNAVTILRPLSDEETQGLGEAANDDSLRIVIERKDNAPRVSETAQDDQSTASAAYFLTAYDRFGRVLAQTDASIEGGEQSVIARFNIPEDLRTQITRVSIDGEAHAAATLLLDESWRKRPVGILAAQSEQLSQALLREDNYIGRALEPYSRLTQGDFDTLMSEDLAVIVLTDSVTLNDEQTQRLTQWVRDGGTLLRFAGPRLAAEARSDDPLLPVNLRAGERVLQSGFAGTDIGRLAPAENSSPLNGVTLNEDIVVERHILAQPDASVEERTWLRMQDGTPIITGREEEQGQVVLIHTTANADWSNFALSGAYVDIMRRIVERSQGVENSFDADQRALPPITALDATGRLTSPPPSARAMTSEDVVENAGVSARFPAGFYGDSNTRYAHNIGTNLDSYERLGDIDGASSRQSYAEVTRQKDFKGPLLAAAGGLAMLDLLVLLGQRGALPGTGGRRQRSNQRSKQPKPA